MTMTATAIISNRRRNATDQKGDDIDAYSKWEKLALELLAAKPKKAIAAMVQLVEETGSVIYANKASGNKLTTAEKKFETQLDRAMDLTDPPVDRKIPANERPAKPPLAERELATCRALFNTREFPDFVDNFKRVCFELATKNDDLGLARKLETAIDRVQQQIAATLG